MRQCFPKCVPQTLLPQDVNKYICKVTSKEFEKQGVAWISSLVIFLGFETLARTGVPGMKRSLAEVLKM